MRLRSSLREQIFGEALAGEGSRNNWQQLFLCSDFTGNRAGRVRVTFEWEQRIAGDAVEEVDKTLLGGLRNGVSRSQRSW